MPGTAPRVYHGGQRCTWMALGVDTATQRSQDTASAMTKSSVSYLKFLPRGRNITPRRHVLLALSWYSEGLHAGVAKFAKEARWALDASLLHSFQPTGLWHGDGIIWVAGVNARVDEFVRRCRKPVVNIGYTNTPGIPRVMSDPKAVMKMALEHFKPAGFRHFAFYLHANKSGPRMKMRAFKEAVEESGGTFFLIDLPKELKQRGTLAKKAPYQWLAEAVRKLPGPLAVVAETDDPAIQIVHACIESGIRIPSEVAVLGINDDFLRCPLSSIPLSSIDDNMEGIGYRAAQILNALMSGHGNQPDLTLLPPRGLTVRQSTDAMAVKNPEVAQAMQIIRDRFREDISANLVAAMVPVSKRHLHTIFVGEIGHSIAEELMRRRIAYAAELLLEMDLKIPFIARRCGLRDANRLCRNFRRIRGITPGAFRRRVGSSWNLRRSRQR